VLALLALPGVREADEAEQQLRAAHAAELMRPEDETGEVDLMSAGYGRCVMGSVVAARVAPPPAAETSDHDLNDDDDDVEDEEEVEEAGMARSLAMRMLRAASNALWRSEPVDQSAWTHSLSGYPNLHARLPQSPTVVGFACACC